MIKRFFEFLLTFLFFVNFSFSQDKIDDKVNSENKKVTVISLSPAITETLFYFGYGENIIGRTDYCTYPSEAKQISSMGSMFSPNVEKIVYIKPDYIIFQSHYDKRLKKQVEDMGLKTLTLETPTSIKEILEDYAIILSIFNVDLDKNEKFIAIKRNIEMLIENGKKIKNRPKIYYSLGSGHVEYTAGKGSFIDDAINIVGGKNIVEDSGWTYPLEALIVKQPDIIIISKVKYEAMLSNSKYNQLEALKDSERVIIAEEDEITISTPRLLLITLNKIQKAILDFNYRNNRE